MTSAAGATPVVARRRTARERGVIGGSVGCEAGREGWWWLIGACLRWLPRSGRPALLGVLAADWDAWISGCLRRVMAGCPSGRWRAVRNEEGRANQRRGRLWAGIDAGKGRHWAAVVDETGATVWSKKIGNGEFAILAAVGEVVGLADCVSWAVGISGTASTLLLACSPPAVKRPSTCRVER